MGRRTFEPKGQILVAGCDGYVAKPIAYKQLLADARLLSTDAGVEGRSP